MVFCFFSVAEASSLQKLSYAEYSDAMNNMDTNYLLDLDFLLVVFCQEGTYSSLMSAFLHGTILPVNKGAFLRDGLNLDQSHYQNL